VARCSLFCVLLVLTSCGGQKQPQPPAAEYSPEPAPAASAKIESQPDSRPVIVAFGDSLTAGYGVETGLSYPDFLQKDLDHASRRYRVVNAGISGDTTSGGLSRLDTVTQLAPKIVILELGGNDGLRGLPLSTTRSNLEQIVEGLRKSGAQVVLAGITLPPNYGPDYIREFESIYKDVASKYKLPLLPFLLKGVVGVPGMMQTDGIHATAAGNEVVAQLVLTTLRPLL
jgi:acyl-CoA thioesterase-1